MQAAHQRVAQGHLHPAREHSGITRPTPLQEEVGRHGSLGEEPHHPGLGRRQHQAVVRRVGHIRCYRHLSDKRPGGGQERFSEPGKRVLSQEVASQPRANSGSHQRQADSAPFVPAEVHAKAHSSCRGAAGGN